MVESFARFLVQRHVAWTVVVSSLLLAVVCGWLAIGVEQDDDVLAFLPPDNPDIAAFRRINERFGSTDIALVGIRTDDPFSADFITRLQALTTDLRDMPGLDSALTLTNVNDFSADPETGGIIQSELIPAPPTNEAEHDALRDKVMSRDHIVGTLVSKDADAVLVLAFARAGSQPREIAGRVRQAVEKRFDGFEVFWGGAPFISTWIYETTQADMAKLTPWAVGVIILIMMVAFRDVLGTFLGLLATGIGIAVSRALMALLDVSFNIVLSSMPIILFAVGSAYAIHILSHYDQHARRVGENPEAVVHTLVGTGPTVIAAGLTTVAGLLSFIMMDIEPMRTFGIFTAVGLFVALTMSLTFVPAVVALFPRPIRKQAGGPLDGAMQRLAGVAREHRVIALVVIVLVGALGLRFAGNVKARMDLRAFFDPGSEPYVAQDFLDEAFGGSQFLQLDVVGDLEEPEVLRELGRIGDAIEQLPHVSDVRGVEDVISIVGDAMSGARRIPDTKGQVGLLYRFLASDPASSQLVTEDRREALIQVKIDSSEAEDLDAVLAGVTKIVSSSAITRYRLVTRDEEPETVEARVRGLIAARVLALAHAYGVPVAPDAAARIPGWFDGPRPVARPDRVRDAIRSFLTSDECFVELTPEEADRVADAVVGLGADADADALEQALTEALTPVPVLDEGLEAPAEGADAAPAVVATEDGLEGEPEVPLVDEGKVQDLLISLDVPLSDAWRRATARAAAEQLLDALDAKVPATPAGERFVAAVASKMQDRGNQEAMVASDAPDAAELTWTVSGMPVLYQGLSRSVSSNQFRSLFFALGLVYLIMTVYYRSPFTGLLATTPTFFTLAMVYGAMGAMGVHLDIGTSMLASIIIGAGVDYAVHLLAGWHARPDEDMLVAARGAVAETSHAIWTNAIMVAGGFFVLTLGDARPLKNVGGLTATAMLVAAIATFAILPVFANKRRYRRPADLRGS